ncbi:MAG: mechanosensitive ion channel family protein [Candidatus Woesearchaeota archaeon]
MDLNEILNLNFLGNEVQLWLIAIGTFFAILITMRLFETFVTKKLKVIADKSSNKIDDIAVHVIEDIGWPFHIFVPLYFSLRLISIQDTAMRWINYIFIIIMTYYAAKTVNRLIGGIIKYYKKKDQEDNDSIVDFLSKLIKGVIWIIAFMLILSNLGVNITSLIAGLGIGGVAVALALQNILGDLFSSISIYFDKPFKPGDFIIVGQDMGVVKKIGLKTTRLVSLWGQEIVISNNELTSTRINNYKKMEKRRIHFHIGVTYQTPVKKLKKIPEIVKDLFEKTDKADLDRVHFKEFANSSLVYEIAYYVNSPDYNEYMNIQQNVNLGLVERFQKEKIDFAYPTQTIFLNKQ